MDPAPAKIPLKPNSPKRPVMLGGTNGVKLEGWMNLHPMTMKTTMTETFRKTMTALTVEDSWVPLTKSNEISTTTNTAGRLMKPWMVVPSVRRTCCHGEAKRAGGRLMPKLCNKATRVADQPMETVAAPTAYSSTRSQPMIQASNSPMVAYE